MRLPNLASLGISLLAIASAPLGCAADGAADDEDIAFDEAPKIIGTNDLVTVLQDGANIPAKYGPLLDAFGRISNGCTATHIGGGLAIAAGHCFRAPSTRRDNIQCPTYSVAWGFRKDDPSYMTSQCQIVLAGEYNRNRDYAIFVVRPIPPVEVAVDYAARPAVGTPITIFGHPRSRPLEWSQLCTVQPASNGGYGVDMFTHQCDTEGGSSGSSILDDRTLKVIGIHDGGRVPWNYGTFLANTPLAELMEGPLDIPPIVRFTSPTGATATSTATVRGVINVTVSAEDLDGTVSSVTFKLPDGTTPTVERPPFTVSFDTRLVSNRTYTLEATATDDAGGKSTATQRIRVSN